MTTPERKARLRHTAAVAGFMLVCVVIYWRSFTNLTERGAASGGAQYNAAFVPELLAGLLLLLCAVQLVRIWFGGAYRESEDNLAVEDIDDGFKPADMSRQPDAVSAAADAPERWLILRAIVCVGLLLAFIATVDLLGYYIAMPLFLAGVFVTLGVRNVLWVVGLSIGLTLLAGYAFGGLLDVVLPAGFWGISPW